MRFAAVTLVSLAALVGGTYSAFRPTFDSHFARTQTETGDGMLNHYMLEHSWRAVSDSNYCASLLAPPFFHPAPRVYWYSETLLGGAPIYWGLRLTMPYDLAYQWWQIVCTGLNFIAFAWIARWLGCSHLTSILGAFFWAFATSHVNQAMHQQLIPRFWMPPAVYHAWRLAYAPKLKSLHRTLAFTFLQAVTCVYTGWFLAVGLAVFVAAAVRLKPGGGRGFLRFIQADRRKIAIVSGLWGLAFAAFFAPYVLANHGASRDYGECIMFLPGLSAWLTGPEGSRWHDTLEPVLPTIDDECYLFNGFAFLSLVMVAGIHLRLGRNQSAGPRFLFATACLVTAGLWWLLTLNFYQGISPWWLVRFLPGGGAIRCVSRVSLMIDLFAILGAMVWLNTVMPRIRPAVCRGLVLAAVAAAMVYEQTGHVPPSFAKDEFYPKAREYAESIRGADAAFVVPLSSTVPLYTEVLAMWAGLEANVPVINGYSGRVPPGYPYDFEVHVGDYTDESVRRWLKGRFRGRVAILDPNRPAWGHHLEIE